MIHLFAGCHISIRNGYLGAAKTAHALGANAYQYFPKNPRNLSFKDFNQHDATLCRQFCKEHGIASVAHTPYATNLTPSEDKLQPVVASLLNDLKIAEACGSIGVVVHFGSNIDPHNPLKGYELMIDVLNRVLTQWEGNSLILLENIAGKVGTMGTTVEEHIQIRNLVEHREKIGFCFDTCHAFASNLWNGENTDDFFKHATQLDYFSHLKVVHLNNSKYENGSGKDRHANINAGKIPLNDIQDFISREEVQDLPFILETPDENHANEIQLIRGLQENGRG